MATKTSVQRVLNPIESTDKRVYGLLVLLGAGIIWLLYAWYVQLSQGMHVTGLGDWGAGQGAPWALYIGSFVWWIGIAHGGIAISAAVRVFKLEKFRSIARIAEVLTIAALMMAAASIVFDLGRPDRILNTIIYWPSQVGQSPLAWDIAAITAYFVLSLTYLTLSLREDIHLLRDQLPDIWSPIYSAIMIGHSPDESEKMDHVLWWLAVAVLALVALLSGGVVPWLFGLVGAQPGWYGAFAGPSMLIESLATALAMVIVVSAAFRYLAGWDDLIGDDVFVGLSKPLAFLGLGTLWVMLHGTLSGLVAAPTQIEALTQAKLSTGVFWLVVLGIVLPTAYLIAQLLRPQLFSTGGTVAAALVMAAAVLLEKTLFVVEGLLHPTIAPLTNLHPAGVYVPSWVEVSLVGGTILAAALILIVAMKVIPMMELEAADEVVYNE